VVSETGQIPIKEKSIKKARGGGGNLSHIMSFYLADGVVLVNKNTWLVTGKTLNGGRKGSLKKYKRTRHGKRKKEHQQPG